MENTFDIAVLGAGPGGYVAAIRAAQEGFKTLLVESRDVGGTCLNRGCIPTKSLVHSTHLYKEMKTSDKYGVFADGINYDINKIYDRKNEVVVKLRSGIEFLINQNKIELARGKATIKDKNTVVVASEDKTKEFSVSNIIIATGSEPSRPPIPGLDLDGVITSDELLNDAKDYKSLIVIGGGVIGVEFSSVFNNLGCKVTILEAMDKILPTLDKEVSQNLSMIFKKRGVDVFTSAMVKSIEKSENGLKCNFTRKDKDESVEASAVLVSIGRKANIAGLFLDDFSVNTDRGIIVDENYRTNIPNIYAIGDVIHGGIQLAHVASAQASNVIDIIKGRTPAIDMNTIPSCIYTDPEISTVGITQDEAKAKGIKTKVGKFSMSGNGKSIIEDMDRGFVKLIFEEDSHVILGATLMCGRATDIISELSVAVSKKLTIADLSSVIRPHPTFTEAVTEAVEDAEGRAVHLAPKRK